MKLYICAHSHFDSADAPFLHKCYAENLQEAVHKFFDEYEKDKIFWEEMEYFLKRAETTGREEVDYVYDCDGISIKPLDIIYEDKGM